MNHTTCRSVRQSIHYFPVSYRGPSAFTTVSSRRHLIMFPLSSPSAPGRFPLPCPPTLPAPLLISSFISEQGRCLCIRSRHGSILSARFLRLSINQTFAGISNDVSHSTRALNGGSGGKYMSPSSTDEAVSDTGGLVCLPCLTLPFIFSLERIATSGIAVFYFFPSSSPHLLFFFRRIRWDKSRTGEGHAASRLLRERTGPSKRGRRGKQLGRGSRDTHAKGGEGKPCLR